MAIPNQEKGQWKPGTSGNPAGKPKGKQNRSTVLRKWLDVPVDFSDALTGAHVKGTVEDQIALALIRKAISGDVGAAKEILDSVYGKVRNEEREDVIFQVIRPKPPEDEM